MKTKVSDITDGFGNSWPRCDLGKKCGMHVVRPGHAACWCENAKEEALLLMKENERMRNELARVNGQTMWICTCGGTDCAGRKENASLWAIAERVAKANDLLVVENAALREALHNAEELERYTGSNGKRQWGKCSAWLHPDDAVVIISAKALDAVRKEAQP